MDHIVILGYIVILMIGTWAAFYTHQTHRRFDLSLLKSLFFYIVVFNLSVFLYLISRYVWINLLRRDLSGADPSLEMVLLLTILAVEIGLAYMLVRVVVELKGGTRLGALNRSFVLAIALLAVIYLIGLRLKSDSGWLVTTNLTVIFGSVAVILCALVVLAVQKHAELDTYRRKAVRGYAYLMLSGYLPFVASYLLPNPYSTYGSALTQLWLNIVPIVWIRSFFLPHYVTLPTTAEGAVLDGLVREYKISKREREIMELILEGKSNKEIEEQLFISFNTVKNHIYNLYQKLGVKSRGQLMHLVMKSNPTASDPAAKS